MTKPAGGGQTPTPDGVAFPVVDGRRSSMAAGRAIFSDAVARVDTALAQDFLSDQDWRHTYRRHVRTLTVLSARSAVHSSRMAADGLSSAARRMTFLRGRDEMDLGTAMTVGDPAAFSSITVGGADIAPDTRLRVPYRGQLLHGDDLRRQLDDWVRRGVVEPGFAASIRAVQDHPQWLDLSDQRLVLLGAVAELSPLTWLLRRGATVAAIDRPLADRWVELLSRAARSPGRLRVPVAHPNPRSLPDHELAARAGLDLTVHTPEAAHWIDGLEGSFTLGTYLYLPGADHVRIVVAYDAIVRRLLARRRDVSLAMLATPTDVYAVPLEAVAMSQSRFGRRPPSAIALTGLSARRLFRAQYDSLEAAVDGGEFGVSDVLVEQQGPNYALAMRMQRWRALDARVHGVLTSVNVAPPTRTRSVTQNRLLAAAYRGASIFGVEVFAPETTQALMSALLVHDLRNPESVAHPAVELAQDWELFTRQANHGGLWRAAYQPQSALPAAVVAGMFRHG
jgi:hypothetical protein